MSQPCHLFFPGVSFPTHSPASSPRQLPIWQVSAPILPAPRAGSPPQPGSFCFWKGWGSPAVESTGSAWLGAEGTTAPFGLPLDLLLDGKLHSLPFPGLGKQTCCVCSQPRSQRPKMTFPSPTNHQEIEAELPPCISQSSPRGLVMVPGERRGSGTASSAKDVQVPPHGEGQSSGSSLPPEQQAAPFPGLPNP